ncbi:uncharacterized protein BP5553_06686 [Venustampulla echinocandica]|uniref:Uncharacterized protein n=1 Tax=Venustampulla echinocandica TaxID=2656787 RepID=A0A370TKM6_9HELO|nr:uncharacterized protein BP5553_06686 [Venustampulla echinocandica]RDL36074.1 hypothetical protein BP5553_06686 [Venustampulla echinocandica]
MRGNTASRDLVEDLDHWHGVLDARKRKQIQDRLAQRARRKRLATLKNNPATSNSKSGHHCPRPLLPRGADTNGGEDSCSKEIVSSTPYAGQESKLTLLLKTPGSAKNNELMLSLGSTNLTHNTSTLSTGDPGPAFTFTSTPSWSTIGPDNRYLSLPNISVYAAMFNNGCILGIVCGHHVPSKTGLQTSITPFSLHPTSVQATVVHSQFIDQFPFPRMRDNLITLSLNGLIDEEIFMADLFTTDSFMVKPEGVSWDAASWSISPSFKAKWGFLFN